MPVVRIWRKRSVLGVMMTRWSWIKLSKTQSGLWVSVPQKPMSAIPLEMLSTTSSLSWRRMLKVTWGYSSRKAAITLGRIFWEGQGALELLVVVFDRADGVLAQIEHLDSVLVKDAAGLGGVDIFGSALDQLGVKLLFQRVDVRADRWLRQIDALRSLGEAFELDHIHKSLQLFKIHSETSFPQGDNRENK